MNFVLEITKLLIYQVRKDIFVYAPNPLEMYIFPRKFSFTVLKGDRIKQQIWKRLRAIIFFQIPKKPSLIVATDTGITLAENKLLNMHEFNLQRCFVNKSLY